MVDSQFGVYTAGPLGPNKRNERLCQLNILRNAQLIRGSQHKAAWLHSKRFLTCFPARNMSFSVTFHLLARLRSTVEKRFRKANLFSKHSGLMVMGSLYFVCIYLLLDTGEERVRFAFSRLVFFYFIPFSAHSA